MRPHVQEHPAEESKKGRGVLSLAFYPQWQNPTVEDLHYLKGKRSVPFPPLIPSHISTFSARPGMKFHSFKETLNLWHLPNVREDLDGPLQPEVVALDIQFFCRLVEKGSEEGGGCSD